MKTPRNQPHQNAAGGRSAAAGKLAGDLATIATAATADAAECIVEPCGGIGGIDPLKRFEADRLAARVGGVPAIRRTATHGKDSAMPRSTPATQRRRRRPGEPWDLWAVRRQGSTIGYLVTDRQRMPQPVAFVPGIGPGPLTLALAIRADNGKARHARDLRRRRGIAAKPIVGKLLMPVDSLGRTISTDSTFAAARFVPPGGYCGAKGGFMTYTHAGLDYEIAKEKGGLQLNPEPAQPGSESSDVEGCKAA